MYGTFHNVTFVLKPLSIFLMSKLTNFVIWNNVRFGRSGLNIISKSSKSLNSKIDSVKRNFIDERVKSFWNMLPCEVKNASSLNCFKYELETYKKKCSEYGESSKGHFWELSCEVLNRIERNGYVENKNLHNEYLKKNPFVAKAKFINLN